MQASEAEQRERGDAARQDNAKLLSDLQEVSQLIELLEVRPISPMYLPCISHASPTSLAHSEAEMQASPKKNP